MTSATKMRFALAKRANVCALPASVVRRSVEPRPMRRTMRSQRRCGRVGGAWVCSVKVRSRIHNLLRLGEKVCALQRDKWERFACIGDEFFVQEICEEDWKWQPK